MYGNTLGKIMEERKITYRELGRLSGLSINALHKIVNYQSDTKQSSMICISRALNMDVLEVFNLEWRK